jgi:hypothetical protein
VPKTSSRVEELASQIKLLSEALATEGPTRLPKSQARRLRKAINEAYEKLRGVMDDLDPIKHPGFVFDPSNPNIVARIIGITMIAQPRKPLSNARLERFYGSGVYALYYNGDFAAYAPISKREHPIYVGKADPADPAGKTAREQGDKLSTRLNEHAKNISKAKTTLRLEDFEYRALVVQTGWQNSAESYLINLFKPIWNNEMGISYGFGKHGDAPETRANLRSPWDTLHPGRDWAHRDPNMKDARAPEQITESIAQHLTQHAPLTTIDEILRRFLEEMRTLS